MWAPVAAMSARCTTAVPTDAGSERDALARLDCLLADAVRAALDVLQRDPEVGQSLRGCLVGLRSFRVGASRIIHERRDAKTVRERHWDRPAVASQEHGKGNPKLAWKLHAGIVVAILIGAAILIPFMAPDDQSLFLWSRRVWARRPRADSKWALAMI